MIEKNFDFIEEVIKEKPKKWNCFLKKFISAFGITLIAGLALSFLLFLLHINLKELVQEKVHHSANGKENGTIQLEQEDHKKEELLMAEQKIEATLVSIYEKTEKEKKKQVSAGVILYKQQYLYILTSYESIAELGNLQVKFSDGRMAEADLVNQDKRLGVAILEVSKENISEETNQMIRNAVIGQINDIGRETKVVYYKSPYEKPQGVLTGKITGLGEEKQLCDLYFRKLYMDIPDEQIEEGFVFDYAGNMLGMVLKQEDSGKKPTIMTIAVCDIADLLENLLNHQEMGYLGIYGEFLDYLDDNYMSHDMSNGVYISGVEKNSAAYEAGVMNGDILLEINGKKIEDMRDLQSKILKNLPKETISLLLKRKIAGNYKEVRLNVKLQAR